MVTRDIDIFTKLKHVSVGLTITTTDDEFARIFEVDAPPVSKRLEALKMLNDNGIETYAFVGPLFPHFSENLDALGSLFDEIKNTGTKSVWVEHINLSGPKFSRLYNLVKDKVSADLLQKFKDSQKPEYKERINVYVKKVLKEKGLELVTGELEEHGKVKH